MLACSPKWRHTFFLHRLVWETGQDKGLSQNPEGIKKESKTYLDKIEKIGFSVDKKSLKIELAEARTRDILKLIFKEASEFKAILDQCSDTKFQEWINKKPKTSSERKAFENAKNLWKGTTVESQFFYIADAGSDQTIFAENMSTLTALFEKYTVEKFMNEALPDTAENIYPQGAKKIDQTNIPLLSPRDKRLLGQAPTQKNLNDCLERNKYLKQLYQNGVPKDTSQPKTSETIIFDEKIAENYRAEGTFAEQVAKLKNLSEARKTMIAAKEAKAADNLLKKL